MNSFVKWLRKNNMKLMAVVIIVLMVGFIGGSSLQRYLQSRASGRNKIIAHFADGQEIKNQDLLRARNEISILKNLRADAFLSSQGMHGMLLGELIFSEGRIRPRVFQRINSTIIRNNYLISQEQLADIYNKQFGGNLYWLLLKKECRRAGIRISKKTAGNALAQIIPQIFQNTSYQQFIGTLVNKNGIPEEKILSTFATLLSVNQYGRMVCSASDVTENEIRFLISSQANALNAEFVNLKSFDFFDEVEQPTEQEIIEQFEQYKNIEPLIEQDNPYGFGYKLPASVKLEYLAVKLEDVKNITTMPTQEDAEELYQQNRARFTEEVPIDPNDPNAGTAQRQKTYPEVAEQILNNLKQSRINSKAQKILQKGEASARKPLEQLGKPWDKLTDKDFIENARDYEQIAKDLEEKYKINVFSGQTGLLCSQDIQKDRYLSRLYMSTGNQLSLPLAKMAFAIDKLGMVDLSIYNTPEPRLYESFGPLKDRYSEIMVLARITEAKKPRIPKNINLTIDKTPMHLTEDTDKNLMNQQLSIREKVAGDLRNKAAMEFAGETAENFIANVEEKGWNESLQQLNRKFSNIEDMNIPDVNTFRLQNSTFKKIADFHIETIKIQNSDNPAITQLLNNVKSRKMLADKMYSLIPADSNSLPDSPKIVKFRPDFAVYVIRDATLDQLTRQQFEQVEATQIFRKTNTMTASLAAVHYNPRNIIERTNFEWKKEETRPAEDGNDVLPASDVPDTNER